jgi:hypothetical protein
MLTYDNNFVPLAQLKTISMPRQARKTSGTGIYHVMLRGINRQDMMQSGSRIQTTGPNNGHQLRDYSKSSNKSENRLIYPDLLNQKITLSIYEIL